MNIDNKKAFLTVKDHSVSKDFELYQDEELDMLLTSLQTKFDFLVNMRKRRFFAYRSNVLY
jgi:hypothetical protein